MISLFPVWVDAPIKSPEFSEKIIIQDNSFVAQGLMPFFSPQTAVLGDFLGKDDINYLQELLREKYPEMADILICMWKKESSYGRDKYIKGDNGLAYGDFQIHLDKHDITEWCAMDFECSLDFCYNKIRQGQGYLWSSYSKCL